MHIVRTSSDFFVWLCSELAGEMLLQHLSKQPYFILLLLALGFSSLLRSSLSFLRWLYSSFLRPRKDLKLCYGSWALITGATDGIGRALAFSLAHEGLNLVLVGRNPAKVKDVADSIINSVGNSNNIKIKCVVVDFSDSHSSSVVEIIEEAVKGLDVGIVVNNAGTTYPFPMLFHEVEEQLWKSIVDVNVAGTTTVTRAVIKGMIEKKKGVAVNIGSAASVAVPAFPYSAVYAATKAYVNQLSRSLHVEYKNEGIHVQCQIPMWVATKMISISKPSIFIPSPEDYANAALRWIGYGDPQCCPHWPHSIQQWLLSFLPEYVLNTFLVRNSINKRKKYFTNGN